jgi:hypothetical protein
MDEFVLNYDCPTLSIGEKKGDWGFIDFIAERELGQTAVMKGVDCVGRAFLVIKAEFVLENGEVVPSFATFFQKYVNNKNIWQCFNYKGMEMLYTSYIGDGYPVTVTQIELLKQLLTEREVDLLNIPSDELFHSNANYIRLRCDRISSFY